MVNKAAVILRAQLADPSKIVVCPGVQDGLSARVCLDEGFETLYMTGAGTSMSLLGLPDLGLATADDMVRQASMLASLSPSTPLIADADTGYGGPLAVARLITRYIAAGVAAAHIEDQALTKRCGHLLGKELVALPVYLARIRAAVAARAESGGDIVIIARSDALQSLGFDEAVARLRAAVDAGADMVFLEGMGSVAQMRACVEAMEGVPCLLNMVQGGVTPLVGREEARAMGYRVVIWPCFAMTAAVNAWRAAARELKGPEGRLGEERDGEGRVRGGVRECFEVCGLSKFAAFDKEMGGEAFANGV